MGRSASGTRMGPSSYGKGQAAMLWAPNRHVLPWQDTQAMQDTCRRMFQLGLKMSLVQHDGLGCINGRQTQQGAHRDWTRLRWKPERGVQQGSQRSQRRARRKTAAGKQALRLGELQLGQGAAAHIRGQEPPLIRCAKLGLVATSSPGSDLLSQTGCIHVVHAPGQTRTNLGQSDSLREMGKRLADPLLCGWQECEWGRQAPPASLLMPVGSPAWPEDEDQMSVCLQGAGKAATSAQLGSSHVTAGTGTDPPPSPQPCPTSAGSIPYWPSTVPLPAPTAAPLLSPFGMQMAGDCRG